MSIPPIVTQCAGGAPRVASHRAGSAAYAVVHPRRRCSKALLTRQALLHAPPWRIGASQTVLALLHVGEFGGQSATRRPCHAVMPTHVHTSVRLRAYLPTSQVWCRRRLLCTCEGIFNTLKTHTHTLSVPHTVSIQPCHMRRFPLRTPDTMRSHSRWPGTCPRRRPGTRAQPCCHRLTTGLGDTRRAAPPWLHSGPRGAPARHAAPTPAWSGT